MKSTLTPSRWRNLGIIAHIDAGKTTLTERLLWKAGAIHRMGEVHDGAATTDFSAIERERGITIGAAAVQLQWTPERGEPHRLTLIDTPGHIDFAIEVERSLRVLDGAVAVFCGVAGVQPQSETVWRQARRHGIPLVAFVNKLDRPGADFARVVAALRTELDANPWPLGLPLGRESDLHGWVDLVGRRIVSWHDDARASSRAWTPDEQHRYAAQRDALVVAVADHDAALAEHWLAGDDIDTATLTAALRRATLAQAGMPVLAGSAFKTKGMELLLDAIVDYLPSPMDRPPVQARSDAGDVALAPVASGPLAALVFKIARQEHGPLTFVRVYSGRLAVGDTVWSAHGRQRLRVGRLVVVQADRGTDVDCAQAGEIVAVTGWKHAVSGDTLSECARPLVLDRIDVQPAVLAWRLVPATSSDLLRLGQGLAALAQEDPSLRVGVDPDSGETLLWGMGELHLDVTLQRLRDEWSVAVDAGAPRVAYQETPLQAVQAVEGRVAKQNGGSGQFARVVIDVAPAAGDVVTFVDRTRGGIVPPAFVAATEKGVRAALLEGLHGYPVVGVEVTLSDGQTHVKDSSDTAFQRAGFEAAKAALALAGTRLLEPVMTLAIDTPTDHVGDVIGDLQRRLGRIGAIAERGTRSDVAAHAPLAQLTGYATALRSLTRGRASAAVAFAGYAPVAA